jgi:hypothetical protein
MKASQGKGKPSLEEIRQELSARLRTRLPQIEEAIYNRVLAVSARISPTDPEYLAGLRHALKEVIEYVLEGIEKGEMPLGAIPPAARAQARRAARSGIPLDTVLRRYHAGDRLLGEFIMGEADELPSGTLQAILRTQGPQIDHLTAGVAMEHMHEVERLRRSPAQHRRERITKLLDGDVDEDVSLEYDFTACHIGMISGGPTAEMGIRELAKSLDCQVLLVLADDDLIWAWLGCRSGLLTREVEELLPRGTYEFSLAMGEPRRDIDGWRLTHREARIALRGMLYRPQHITRVRDIILIAAVMQDPLLATSLSETYLAPLEGRGDYGKVLRTTLRAYLKADQNAATTAAVLGVARHTVERRLRRAEEKLGQDLRTCYPQLQVALGIEELVTGEPSSEAKQLARA